MPTLTPKDWEARGNIAWDSSREKPARDTSESLPVVATATAVAMSWPTELAQHMAEIFPKVPAT